MRSAFSLNQKILSELQYDIDNWAEVLVGVVPIQRLDECYIRAMHEHSKLPPESRRFPLVATEVTGAMFALEREVLLQEKAKQVCIYCVARKKDNTLPPCPFHRKVLSIQEINSRMLEL